MKKIVIAVLLISSLLMMSESEYVIPNDAIRFRIIPNSNSSEDIIMKEKSTKEIMSVASTFDNININTSREEILKNINIIENRLNNLFVENNYDEKVIVKYGLNEFPEKVYKGIKYEKGLYESLVIEIGEAKGNNYWCVLYPPLCLIDDNIEETQYRSKIIELFNKYF